jgi:uncharacterized membrane protein YjjP (DUF1212 family)
MPYKRLGQITAIVGCIAAVTFVIHGRIVASSAAFSGGLVLMCTFELLEKITQKQKRGLD